MSKITDQAAAKIFAMYLGCEVYDQFSNINNRTLVEVNINGECLIKSKTKHNRSCSEIKLLLTHLSSITDEDAIEVCKIDYDIFRNTGYSFKVGKKYKNEKVVFCIKSDSQNEIIPIKLYSVSSLAAQYLISKGYAVPIWLGINHPLNGKTPIELGIAIDKTLK